MDSSCLVLGGAAPPAYKLQYAAGSTSPRLSGYTDRIFYIFWGESNRSALLHKIADCTNGTKKKALNSNGSGTDPREISAAAIALFCWKYTKTLNRADDEEHIPKARNQSRTGKDHQRISPDTGQPR